MKIYLLENESGQKYVGKTNSELKIRHGQHLCPSNDTSSRFMNPKPNEISLLEECDDDNSFEREKYWINYYDTININKLNKDKKQYDKIWNKENIDWYANYHQENKVKRYNQLKERRKFQQSWGGEIRYDNLCMLKISMDLFQ
tara:strand:+ start:110 stop:538 length:429 start_codon:yes stop_codon:yes gene_type:complete